MSLPKDWTEDDYQRAREKLGLPASTRHREITAAWAEREKETSEALRRLENEGGAVVSETLTSIFVCRKTEEEQPCVIARTGNRTVAAGRYRRR